MAVLRFSGLLEGSRRFLGVQLALLGVATFLATIFFGAQTAQAVGFGAFIPILANYIFAWKIFSAGVYANPQLILRRVYWAEALKVLVTIIGFCIAIRVFGQAFLAVLIGYGLLQMMGWTAALCFKRSSAT